MANRRVPPPWHGSMPLHLRQDLDEPDPVDRQEKILPWIIAVTVAACVVGAIVIFLVGLWAEPASWRLMVSALIPLLVAALLFVGGVMVHISREFRR